MVKSEFWIKKYFFKYLRNNSWVKYLKLSQIFNSMRCSVEKSIRIIKRQMRWEVKSRNLQWALTFSAMDVRRLRRAKSCNSKASLKPPMTCLWLIFWPLLSWNIIWCTWISLTQFQRRSFSRVFQDKLDKMQLHYICTTFLKWQSRVFGTS